MKLVRLFGFVLSLIVINIYFVTATNASGAMESNDTGSNGLKVEWNVTIGGNLSDTATSVHETTDGGYIIAGTTKSFSEPASIEDADVWLVKLDSSGNIQWNKTFEDTPSAKNPSVYQTHDGGYVISYSRLGNVIDVIKTDFNGNKEWNKSTNNQLSYSISIKEMINNDYLLVGAIKFSSFIIFKTDSNASPYFNKTVNAFFAHSFDETSDGGFILTTQQNSDQSINSIKLDNNFNEIWNKDYGESIRNWIKQVTSESADGNYLIVGSGDYPGCCLNGSTNIFLFKIDLNGNQIWNKSFEGQGRDVINSMAKSSDNGHILVGGTDSFGHGSHDVWIVRLDSDGNIKWNSTIGGPFYDSANSIKPTSDGGYIVVGNTTSLATGEDMWIIKLAQINHSSIGINYFNPVNLRPNVTEPNNVSFTVFPDTSDNV
ncbi:hypothetical protein HY636_02395, partial [Candidatus Woesearchaeota archaeon]|nr:hypothetical protein [Candidatus Woesearchaeota archaeon]